MPEKASERVVVDANAAACMDVITDFERYPEWATDIKSVNVERQDDDGRGGLVSFRVAAMGRSASGTLEYFYGSNPLRVGWRLVDGDTVRRYDGRYTLMPLSDEQTEVTYDLEVELAVPLPAFVRRRAEARIIRTALEDLRNRVEARTSA